MDAPDPRLAKAEPPQLARLFEAEEPPDAEPLSSVPPSSTPAKVAAGETGLPKFPGPPRSPGDLGSLEEFEIQSLLGCGGMGMVFLARHGVSGEPIAIKMLRPEFSSQPELRRRFLAEAEHQRRLRHPAVAPVFDVRQSDDGPFFTMPYCPEGSLARRLHKQKPLEGPEVLRYARPVAEALAFAHARGIIHRDIKPANVLLGAEGKTLLADFGLARSVFNESVIEDTIVGTPPYLSPAVAAGQAEDTRCDIYAFGALLYELLTGHSPYSGKSLAEIRDKILKGPPPPVRELNPDADPKLAAVAEAAMGREHRDRYANMADVLSDLDRVREGHWPRGPHAFWRLQRTLSAHSGAVRAAGVALLITSLTLVVVWVRSERHPAYTFSSPAVPHWDLALPLDHESEPGQELAVFSHDRVLTFSGKGSPLREWNLPVNGIESVWLGSLPGKAGLHDLVVSWTDQTNLNLSVVNNYPFEVARYTAPGPLPNPTNRITAELDMAFTLEPAQSPDQRRKVLALQQAVYRGGTRALCCFDAETKTLEWRAEVGPYLLSPLLLDLNGDGYPEVLTGSGAPDNGARSPDGSNDDSHSYAFAFSTNGRKLWQCSLGGIFSSVDLLPARLDGTNISVVGRVFIGDIHHRTNSAAMSRVVVLSPRGEATAVYEANLCFLSVVAADLDQDGRDEILVSDCDGRLHLLDHDLRLLRKQQVYRAGPPRAGSLDRADLILLGEARTAPGQAARLVAQARFFRQEAFTNPGYVDQPQDKVIEEDLRILVLDNALNLAAEHRLPYRGDRLRWNVVLADVDGDHVDEAVYLGDQVKVFKLPRR